MLLTFFRRCSRLKIPSESAIIASTSVRIIGIIWALIPPQYCKYEKNTILFVSSRLGFAERNCERGSN